MWGYCGCYTGDEDGISESVRPETGNESELSEDGSRVDERAAEGVN